MNPDFHIDFYLFHIAVFMSFWCITVRFYLYDGSNVKSNGKTNRKFWRERPDAVPDHHIFVCGNG